MATRRPERTEARKAASLMGASLQFPPTEGDTRIRANLETTLTAAKIIRQVRPDVILAPSGNTNQHPDHRETCAIARDAFRLARYGKTPGLEEALPHAAQLLLFYDISTEAVGMPGLTPLMVDISNHVEKWKTLMGCHESQTSNLEYIDLQLSRARSLGIQMGVHSAVRLYSAGPLLVPAAVLFGEMTSPRL